MSKKTEVNKKSEVVAGAPPPSMNVLVKIPVDRESFENVLIKHLEQGAGDLPTSRKVILQIIRTAVENHVQGLALPQYEADYAGRPTAEKFGRRFFPELYG